MRSLSDRSLRQLTQIRHWGLDLDGTIYKGDQLFATSLPFLRCLRDLDMGYTFLTNNTSRSRKDHLAKIHHLGISVNESEIITPADATMAWLKQNASEARSLALLGTPSLCREFEEAGWRIDRDNPHAVVIGFDMTLTYERLCRAAYWIESGLPFVATHPDFICPTNQPTTLIDCGAICACLTAATGRHPVVIGKPQPTMLREIASRHQLRLEDIAIVGDRLYTDIAMAQNAGIFSVLVLSGETTAEQAQKAVPPPDLILADLGELETAIRATHSPSARIQTGE